ncbi:MAG TPA: protein-glutamate O-methyltransferase CheR [Baekduia sp.]|nr:protein-glutamate O-methyltransferase CheR [Baekduia sp.]
MTDGAALARAAQLLRRRCALALDAPGLERLREVLDEEAAARDVEPADLVAVLPGDPPLLQAIVDGVTLQETSWFRDPVVFEALATEVLPALEDPVRVWSAGCADGQEAYSAAMLLEEAGRRDFLVLGTDVSARALAQARDGIYGERRLRGLSPERLARHFEPAGDGRLRIRDALRARVRFEAHNVASAALPPAASGVRLVLCRNVLIYVDRHAVTAFLDRLHDALAPGALLVVGAAESLWHLSERFELVRLGERFAYRRADEQRGAPPPMARAPARPAPRPSGSALTVDGVRQAADGPAGAPADDAQALLAAGERALAGGRAQDAVATFRRAVYVAPDSPLAHLQLGLALEAAGDAGAARAFRAALAALGRVPRQHVEEALDGFRAEELERLLRERLGERA